MGLSFKKSLKNYLPKIIGWAIVIILALLVLKVALWENKYYSEKEGSERAVAEVVGDVDDEGEPSTEEVTDEDRKNYTVAANRPRYISIETLGIKNARVYSVGQNSKGQMQTPYSIYDAGWYNKSSVPGEGGTAIFDGHSGVGTSGIFSKLNKLKGGEQIKIEMGDSRVFTYRVYDSITVPLSEANQKMTMLMSSPVSGQESISLISCTGTYSQKQRTYLSRQFVRATLVN